MIADYKSKEEFKKHSNIVLLATFIIFGLFSYRFYLHLYYVKDNYINLVLLKLLNVNSEMGFLGLKLFPVLLMIITYLIWTTSNTIKEKDKELYTILGFGFFILYLGLSVAEVFIFPANWASFVASCIFFVCALAFLLESKKIVAKDLRDDRMNLIESQFDQYRPLIEHEYSVNIPYRYLFQGKECKSWINVVNPFRASLVGGTPGSGKSFAVIEEYMRQFTMKGFTGLIYDFKYPTLTKKQYNYLNWYKNKYKITPKFYVINFDDPAYSHRCNPIAYDDLKTISDADEATKTLMLNINKTWKDKEGDFFTDSANVYTSMNMWYLKLATEKYDYDVCSLPHLIAFSTFESTEIMFMILNAYEDLRSKMKPFSEALEKGALEQLAGQVASAGIALSKISSPEIFYILSGNDFSFHLNDPTNPKILCVGNNPSRSVVYAAPLALVMAKVMKSINMIRQINVNGEWKKIKNAPSFFQVDEFPTIYLRGIDELIASARSNLVATMLGFQSFAQVIADYTQPVADKILRICGTRIMGQMMDQDAELISKTIGKQKVVTQSYNYSASDVSKTEQTQLLEIVAPERLAQFSQGSFAGMMADDFKWKMENKIFCGEVIADVEMKSKDEDIPLPLISDFTPENIEEQILNFKEEYGEIIGLTMNYVDNIDINLLSTFKGDTKIFKSFIDELIVENDVFISKERLDNFYSTIDFMNYLTVILLDRMNEKHTAESHLKNMNNEIRTGLINKNKNTILADYQRSIYEDVYRIICLEIEDLNIIEKLMQKDIDTGENKNTSMMCNLFKSLSNRKDIQDATIKEKLNSFIQKVEG